MIAANKVDRPDAGARRRPRCRPRPSSSVARRDLPGLGAHRGRRDGARRAPGVAAARGAVLLRAGRALRPGARGAAGGAGARAGARAHAARRCRTRSRSWSRRSSDPRDELVVIEALILAETESQKGILIGAGGQMIKSIGMAARARSSASSARACTSSCRSASAGTGAPTRRCWTGLASSRQIPRRQMRSVTGVIPAGPIHSVCGTCSATFWDNFCAESASWGGYGCQRSTRYWDWRSSVRATVTSWRSVWRSALAPRALRRLVSTRRSISSAATNSSAPQVNNGPGPARRSAPRMIYEATDRGRGATSKRGSWGSSPTDPPLRDGVRHMKIALCRPGTPAADDRSGLRPRARVRGETARPHAELRARTHRRRPRGLAEADAGRSPRTPRSRSGRRGSNGCRAPGSCWRHWSSGASANTFLFAHRALMADNCATARG